MVVILVLVVEVVLEVCSVGTNSSKNLNTKTGLSGRLLYAHLKFEQLC